MKKLILTLFMIAALCTPVCAGEYKYVSAAQVKDWMSSGTPVSIVDIQVKNEFDAHHLKGSIATYSYPVKSDTDKAKLDGTVEALKKNNTPVVVVCPRGKGGAKRCYDYLAGQGIAQDRLLILEKGIAGWPYKNLVE
ncbi:MAG: rhodanese-like domain-containing protein [Desulfobacterales bacterium]|nr:rhodanese-like domain-containing protein [Desulfobacterales bacterium]